MNILKVKFWNLCVYWLMDLIYFCNRFFCFKSYGKYVCNMIDFNVFLWNFLYMVSGVDNYMYYYVYIIFYVLVNNCNGDIFL